MEDYKEKYDKAIDRIRDLIYNQNPPALDKNIMEEIFPELKENEDERIRKELIEHCKNQAKPYIDTGNECPQIQSWIDWLEKQSEQKPFDYENATIVQQDFAPKVEPKFHEGDWVVDSQGLTHQIERVVEIVTTHTFGYDIVGGGYFNDDNEGVHLWSIKDAKDGDVLMANAPFIFNGNLEGGIGCPGAHCGINTLGKFQIPEDKKHWTGHTTTPATKEQRDLLFSKMKEAGYEWLKETHQLKKIEQKSAWSEEDEKNLREIIDEIEVDKSYAEDDDIPAYDRCLNWLKSLKDRITWKPSEKQIHAFEQVYCWYNDNFAPSETLTSLYDDLKKVKD